MEDTREIADTLVDNSTVILNLEGIDMELAQRIIDFTSGACYSLGGTLQKVSSYIFVLGPYNVDITGDLQNILGGNSSSVRKSRILRSMDKDEFFIKRIRELANLSYQRDIVTFSDFLNLNEQNIVNDQKNQMPGVMIECSGGYEQAERQMVAFHPDALLFPWEYPITCLKIATSWQPNFLKN